MDERVVNNKTLPQNYKHITHQMDQGIKNTSEATSE